MVNCVRTFVEKGADIIRRHGQDGLHQGLGHSNYTCDS